MLKQVRTIPSCRVKSAETHKTQPQLLLGMYDGTIQIYNTNSFESRIYQICEKTVRTAIFYEPLDYILAGDDLGYITVLDRKLQIIAKIKAHKDFVRKLKCDKELYSCSDDGLIKSWCLKSFKNLFIFKGHQHFVMDLIIGDLIFSVSLDCTVKMWERNGTCTRTFTAHERGINCIAKFGNGYLTGSDDFSVKLWETNLINSAQIHSHNINNIKVFNKLIFTCSEDGTAKVLDENLRVIHEIRHGSRIWDVAVKDNFYFIATDDGLLIYQKSAKFMRAISNDKIFYYVNDTLFYNRLEKNDGEIVVGIQKEMRFDDVPSEIIASPSGKMLCINFEFGYKIYSVLGSRLRTSGVGRAKMIDDSLYLKISDSVQLYSKNEMKADFGFGEDAFFYDQVYILRDRKILGCKNGEEFDIEDGFKNFFKVDDFFVIVYEEKIVVRNAEKIVEEIIISVSDSFVYENTFYYIHMKSMKYLLITNEKVIPYLGCVFEGNFIGVVNYNLCTYDNGISMKEIDSEFIDFQKNVLNGVIIPYSNNSKAVGFLMAVNNYAEALNLVDNMDLKFEILLKLDRLDECKELANNKAKNIRLAKALVAKDRFKEAAVCYKKGEDFYSAFILDSDIDLGDDLDGNIGLLKYLHEKKYQKAGAILENTMFYEVFKKFYLE